MHIFPFVVSILSKIWIVKYEDCYKTSVNLIFIMMKFQNLKNEVTSKKLFCDHVIMQRRYFHTRLFYRKENLHDKNPTTQ